MDMETPNILRPLTPKEMGVLEFIESFICDHGFAPTFQEIKDHFGFASYNSVQRYLKQLQAKNYIHVPGGNQKRAISVLHSPGSVQQKLAMNSDKASTSLSESLSNNPNAVSTQQPETHFVDGPRSEFFGNSKEASINTSGSRREEEGVPSARRRRSNAEDDVFIEALSLPLMGRVAAGRPLEALDHNEFVDVPSSLVKNAAKSFALKVEGQSMIEDGILDGDTILVQEQHQASNGEIVVAVVDNEATVKRFFLHRDRQLATPQVELRPANSEMEPLWYSPYEVEIKGVVVGLLRTFN